MRKPTSSLPQRQVADERVSALLHLLKQVPGSDSRTKEDTIAAWLEEAVETWCPPVSSSGTIRPSSSKLLGGIYAALHRELLREESLREVS